MKNQSLSGHLGKPSLAISDATIKFCLNLLVKGFKRIKNKYVIHQSDYENDISKKLVEEIHREQDEKSLTYVVRVDIFTGIINNYSGNTISELDIRFTWNNYYKSYLAVEAKRLFGKGSRRAGAYVEKGLMRFINGKYSSGHSHGIMLGYILSKPIQNAITAVEEAANDRKNKTKQVSPFNKLNGFISYSLVYTSIHFQKNKQKIKIFHIFFDLSN